VTTVVHFDEVVPTIIEGRTHGFCRLIADRKTHRVLGCHVVGQRVADIVQMVAFVIAGGMEVDQLARVAVSFPTSAEILVRAAVLAASELNLPLSWQVHQVATT
jgi:pyruvate/2-oxoglutarate dehydrogenase complex dihydrolipoamide dehydrogenase (E3) component